MDLLVYLAQRAGQVISRGEIIKYVWRGTLVSDEVISRAIYQMRKALGDSPGGESIIETVPKRGYRCSALFNGAPVRLVDGKSSPLRLAVLPFENLSPDPAHAFFADGLHDELLGTLARSAKEIEIISRTTMMRYRRDPPESLGVLARQLGASHVIEGSVRRDDLEIRVTLQLIDARTDQHLWAQNYDRTLGSVLALQSEIADEVTALLSARLTGGNAATAQPTMDPEAYDLYLRAKLARHLLNPTRPLQRFLDVEELLSLALARDPKFALAHLERLRILAWMIEWNYDTSDARRRAALADLEAVRGLLPANDPLTMVAQGLYWSEVEYQPARALEHHSNAQGIGYAEPTFLQSKARLLLRMNRVDEAIRAIRQAAVLDPGNAVLLNVSSALHFAARKPVEALRLSTRAIAAGAVPLSRIFAIFVFTGRGEEFRGFMDAAGDALDSDYRMHLSFRALRFERRFVELETLLDGAPAASLRVCLSSVSLMLAGVGYQPVAVLRGWTHLLLGDKAAAARDGHAVLDFVTRAEVSSTNKWFLGLLTAQAYTFTGDTVLAKSKAREAIAQSPGSADAVAYVEAANVVAWIYAWSDAPEEAVSLLEELAIATPGLGPAYVARDPLCEVPLANNARYRRLVQRLEEEMLSYGRQMRAAD
jgi:TolB-like protein